MKRAFLIGLASCWPWLAQGCALDWSLPSRGDADDAGEDAGQDAGGDAGEDGASCPEGGACSVRNECLLEPHRCHPSAICVDDLEGFHCECADGKPPNVEGACVSMQGDTCAATRCGPQEHCVEQVDGSATCECNEGLHRLGETCAADVLHYSAGGGHTCAILSDKTLWCWGDNTGGAVGLGLEELGQQIAQPRRVGKAADWQSVAAGDGHTCGVRAGELYCWGWNSSGSLGIEDPLVSSIPEPRRVGKDRGWGDLYANGTKTCGLRGTRISCWGDGSSTVDGRSTPVERPYDDWERLGGGGGFGLRAGGQIWSTEKDPVRVGDQAGWSHVSGAASACALREKSLYCWGSNSESQLGLGVGAATTIPNPTRVGSGADWETVDIYRSHACGLRADGLYCWGFNGNGQLGLGQERRGKAESSPIHVSSDVPFQSVRVGSNHTCAVSHGRLTCWGANQRAALGLPEASSVQEKPLAVASDHAWDTLDVAAGHACATSEGTLWCWGSGEAGELGLGGTQSFSAPMQVGDASEWSVVLATTSAFLPWTCGIRSNVLYCWGGHTLVPTQVGTQTNWAALSIGAGGLCAIRQDGSLWCGPVGLSEPAEVASGSTWKAVSVGQSHTCAIKQEGSLWCWGSNDHGECGLGESALFKQQDEPKQVGSDTDWAEIAAGNRHTCGIRTDRSLYCWGSNLLGKLGLGDLLYNRDQYVPVRVGIETAWSHVVVGDDHSCALYDDVAYCWGANDRGQIGNGQLDREKGTVSPLPVTSGITALSAEGAATCGILATGGLMCWGTTSSYQGTFFPGADAPGSWVTF